MAGARHLRGRAHARLALPDRDEHLHRPDPQPRPPGTGVAGRGGAASSAFSWTIRSTTIGGVNASPNIRGNTNAPRAAGSTDSARVRSSRRIAASSDPLAPQATASMPAAVTTGVACVAVAHRTTWPASRKAPASGSIGKTWPKPDVEENSTRMAQRDMWAASAGQSGLRPTT